jgi:O-antigen/teichoic acid export membrane protein
MLKNTLYIFAGRFSNAGFLFLLTLVVSRQLGPALFGIYSFLITVVVAANCFSSLGLDTWMVREVTKKPVQGKHYLSNIIGLKICASLITIALIYLAFQATDVPQNTLNLLWILSISLLFNTVSQTLWHYGNCFKEFIYHSTLWAASNMFKAGFGIALVLRYQQLESLIWGLVTAEALAMILSFWVIRNRFGAFIPNFQLAVWKDFLGRSTPIALGMIFSVLYFRLDIVMLQLLTEEKIVGFYSAAYKLFEVAVILPHGFMLVLFPTLVDEYHSNQTQFKSRFKKVLTIYSLIGGSIALVLWKFSHEIITLIYGDKFLPSADVLDIISWAILLFFINFLLSNILITSGRENFNTWNLVGATILNIILNLVWIPKYGAMGAAWATLFSEIMLIGVLSLQVRNLFDANDPQE